MKKLPIILTAAVITTVLGGTAALAAGNNRRNAYGSENQKTPVYSCTYCEDSSHCFTDADGDGICDHWGTGCGGGQGLGFTDGNGDGVCDNRFSSSRPMDGSGWGHHGGRHG